MYIIFIQVTSDILQFVPVASLQITPKFIGPFLHTDNAAFCGEVHLLKKFNTGKPKDARW